MTCKVCKGEGHYWVDDYNPDGHVMLFIECPYCEHEPIDGDDVVITPAHREVDFEDREQKIGGSDV